MGSESGAGRRSKIERLREKYDLPDLGEEIVRRRTREESESLRQLEQFVNVTVLGAAMEQHGMDPLDGEVANLYRLLTADDVSSGVRVQARKRLERNGVPVDDVVDDFITYQTVNRYLKRRSDYDPRSDDATDSLSPSTARERIYRLQSRLQTVSESTLTQLRNSDDLSIGEFETLVSVSVTCGDCGRHYDIGTLIETGHCNCQEAR